MIGKLKGCVDAIANDHLILDVGGVGYQVFCTKALLDEISTDCLGNFNVSQQESIYIDNKEKAGGKKISLIIETVVREDSFQLLGFANQADKQVFLALNTVKGVGKKLAMIVLSFLGKEKIIDAVINQDAAAFACVPGVGKKMSERIIVELQGKFKDYQNYASDKSLETGEAQVGQGQNDLLSDAISALCNLGINRSKAAAVAEGTLAQNPKSTLSELISLSLQKI